MAAEIPCAYFPEVALLNWFGNGLRVKPKLPHKPTITANLPYSYFPEVALLNWFGNGSKAKSKLSSHTDCSQSPPQTNVVPSDQMVDAIDATKLAVNEPDGEQQQLVARRFIPDLVPVDIYNLCLRYYFHHNIYFTQTDDRSKLFPLIRSPGEPTQYHQEIVSPQGPNVVFASKPIMASSGIYEWTLKAISTHPNDQIGIISSIDHAEEMRYLFQRFGGTDCYFWWGDEGVYRNEVPVSNANNAEDFNGQSWKSGDVITVRVDTHRWTLVFSKNGQIVYERVNIRNGSKFYPIIFCGGTYTKYSNRIDKVSI